MGMANAPSKARSEVYDNLAQFLKNKRGDIQKKYDKGYRWKMMLVINKISDEAGEEEEKIANYRHSSAGCNRNFEYFWR